MAPTKKPRPLNTEPPKQDGESAKKKKFLDIAANRFRRAENEQSEWRQQGIEFYRTYGGNPWPEGVKETREDAGLAALNFNYALSQVNACLGQDIADRKEARYLADYDAIASFGAEALTRVIRKLYNKGKSHREEVESYQDQLVTGVGWSESTLDVMNFPVYPKVGAVDTREMYWDPDAKKNNLRDARWVFRYRKFYLEDAIALFPEKEAELRSIASQTGGTRADPNRVLPRKANATGFKNRDKPSSSDPVLDEDHVFLYDYQYIEPVPYVVYLDPRDGVRKKEPRATYGKIKDEILNTKDEAGVPLFEKVQSVNIVLRRAFRSFLASGTDDRMTEIMPPEDLEIGRFTYQAATGYRSKDENGRVKFFGLMALIYEPQLWIALAVSAAVEHIARSPKGGGGFYNPQFLENPDDFIANGAKPGKWNPVKPGFDPKVHVFERAQPQFPQAYEKLLDIVTSVMPQLTTISDYFKGTSMQERSNVLVTNLQGQTMMVLNPLLDPMNELRVLNATNMALLAQRHLSRDEFNRLCGPMEAEDVTFTYQRGQTGAIMRGLDMKPIKQPILLEEADEETGEPVPITPYDILAKLDLDHVDVQIELGPASVTQKSAIWQAWNQTAMGQKLMEIFPGAAALLAPMLVKNTPGLPTEEGKQLEKELRDMIDQQQNAGSAEMVAKAFQELPPDQVQQLLGFGQQVLMEHQQQAMANANPAAAAPAPPA